MKAPEIEPTSRWSRAYVALWGLWAGFASYAAVVGGKETRALWWWLIGTFAVLEAVGALVRSDGRPMLTEVLGRYVPGWITFSVLALGMWRLSNWVPGWILWPGAAWQVWHFVSTYHAGKKLGGEVRSTGE